MEQLTVVVQRSLQLLCRGHDIWDKVFKKGPSENCGRQPLKNLKGYGLLKH